MICCGLSNMDTVSSCTNRFFGTRLAKRGGDRDRQILKRQASASGGRPGGDWLLVAGQEPPVASHIITLRSGYLHHGIYVGGSQVVHYSGFAHRLRRGPVEEISLARFGRGGPIWVRSTTPANFHAREVVARARSRIGEDCYRLLTNNCEHFCEWCLYGQPRSYQVEAWLKRPASTLRAMLGLIAQSRCGPGGSLTHRGHREPEAAAG